MNKEDLQKILVQEDYKPSTYSLTGGEPDEALCLSFDDGQWHVYYSERGLQTGKVSFGSESEACEYFLKKMRSDPTTKRGWNSGFRTPGL